MAHNKTRVTASRACALVAAVTLTACSSVGETSAGPGPDGEPTASVPHSADDESPSAPIVQMELPVATVGLLDQVWEETSNREATCRLAGDGDFRTILKDYASDWDMDEVDKYFSEKCEDPSLPAAVTTPPPDAEATEALLNALWADASAQERMCSGGLERLLNDTDVTYDPAVLEEFLDAKCDDGAPDGSRENPFSISQSLTGGGWVVSITDVNLDAADIVAAENRFNDLPQAGFQYVIFNVDMTYEGSGEPANPWWVFDFAIIGAAGNTFNDSCGVIPNPLSDVGDMYEGATASANVCISASSEQLNGATVRVRLGRGEPTFLALPTE